MTEWGELEATEILLYGEAGSRSISIRNFAKYGDDKPDDMATAWLEGNTEKYESMRRRWVASHASYQPPPPRKTRGVGMRKWSRGHRSVDHARVRELRRRGLTIVSIARVVGCSFQRVSQICRQTMTMTE